MKRIIILVLFSSFGFCKAPKEEKEGRSVTVQYNKQQTFVFAEIYTDWSDFAKKATEIFKPQEDYDWAVAKVRDESEEGQMSGTITQEQLDGLNCHLVLVASRLLPLKSAGKIE